MSITTALHAGYGPLDEADEVGITEAEVMAEVAASEFRTTAAEVFGRIARQPGTVDLSGGDLSGMSLTFD